MSFAFGESAPGPSRLPALESTAGFSSDEQIDRLSLLRDPAKGGHGFGLVVTLPIEKLRQLAKEFPHLNGQAPRPPDPAAAVLAADRFLSECVAAIGKCFGLRPAFVFMG
jgi:hypothetical protein